MIHSLSGGVMSDVQHVDFAKVEIEGEGVFWYISKIEGLKEGDKVIVPFGRDGEKVTGKVLRIDKNVSSQVSPIPFKHAKYIIEKN